MKKIGDIDNVQLPNSKRPLRLQLKSAQNHLSTCRWELKCEMYQYKFHGNKCVMNLEFDEWKSKHYERMESHYIKIIRAKIKIELIKSKMGECENVGM